MRLSLRLATLCKHPHLLSRLRNHPRRITTSATSPAQVQQSHVQLPKIIISPGSAHHNSLPSFLEYANRVNLASTKTVYVGTHYEYTAALSLLRLGFSLLRTGRKSDAGIDLIGHWILPTLPAPLPVLVQCKVRKTHSVSPRHMRELEGAFQGVPSEWRRKSVIGLLVTTQKATRGVLEALSASPRAMGFLKITPSGTIEQFIWNRAASENGLEGVGVTVRHTPRVLLRDGVTEQGSGWELPPEKSRKKQNRYQDAGTNKDIVLTWMGTPIFPERENLSAETVRLAGELKIGEVETVEKISRKKGAVKKVAATTSARTASKTSKAAVKKPSTTRKSAAQTSLSPEKEVKKKIGRPLGSKNKNKITAAPVAPKETPKRGRPKASKSKGTVAAQVVP